MKKKNSILIIIIFLFFSNMLLAQNLFLISDTTYKNIEFGVDKLNSIYNFKLFANYFASNDLGFFQIDQKFHGNVYKTGITYFQDEEYFNLAHKYNLSNQFSVISNSNIIYLNNNQSNDLSNLERMNLFTGLKYNLNSDFFIAIQSGLESNNQVGVNSNGLIFNINSGLDNYSIDDYILKSNLSYQLLSLNHDRQNSNSLFNLTIFKQIDVNSDFESHFNYSDLRRYNIIYNGNISNLYDLNIENRNKNKIGADLRTNFSLSDFSQAQIYFYINNEKYERIYNNFDINDLKTGTKRLANVFSIEFRSDLNFKIKNLSGLIGINFLLASEENNLYNLKNIEVNDFQNLKKIELLKDFQNSENKLFTNLKFNYTNNDTLKFSSFISLKRYDTPSNDENSDLDEFRSNILFGYSRQQSSIFTFGTIFELQQNHLVYLKSSRSSLNNWLRIFKLSPFISIQTKSFTMRPKIELLANYTVYDYENLNQSIKSYSFRQISLNDSIEVRLTSKTFIESNVYLRYYEFGILFWDEFAEAPQKNNFEIFTKLFYKYRFFNFLNLSFGFRFNQLVLNNLLKSSMKNNYKQNIIAPELKIEISNDKFILNFDFWYEFKDIYEKQMNYQYQLQNIYLNTKIVL